MGFHIFFILLYILEVFHAFMKIIWKTNLSESVPSYIPASSVTYLKYYTINENLKQYL